MLTPNQKVVCVNSILPPEVWEYVKPLTEGRIYTVRAVAPGITMDNQKGNVSVYLEELHNTVNEHGIERGYNAERFVPMEQTDFDDLCQNHDHFENSK